jgi:hypothetical protein
MKKLLLLLAVAAAVAAPAATAGGWATVGLSSLPTSTGPGETWSVDLTVLQHGRTPLEGIAPVLTISNGEGETRDFTGVATGTPGVYRVDVVFPSEGTWTYQVWDDFSQTHTFKPVEITAPAGGAFPWLTVAIAAALVLGLAAAAVLLLRRWRESATARPGRLGEAA